MDETVFKLAVAAVSSGEYSDEDLKAVKSWLVSLEKKENTIKRQLERDKNTFVKNKNKTNSKLKTIRSEIRTIKNMLRKDKGD